MIIKILDNRLFHATYAAVAVKDVRYYLNGICFEPGGYAVASNGHILVRTHCTDYLLKEESDQFEKNVIVKFDKPLPAKAQDIVIDTSKKTVAYCEAKKKSVRGIEVIDGRFPNYRKLTRKPVEKAGADVCIDVSKLSKVQAAGNYSFFRFNVKSATDAALFTPFKTFEDDTFLGIIQPVGPSAQGPQK